ncbi:charged multivesicular body protein 3 isoform X2 [Solea senegalensis]|uniref:Charged multivesicular body protein 3 isoform X2 n=1 Tax=Solea senegalensis TaxID=28829 RepID=A0AAV6QKD9_SOLSE|nr:charged multivesicular body protein 3-like [Solea senegalensis]KAG7493430.1 charged multivesicular body protein 3 isoform X2 [Solea senegalensis]
MKLFGRPPERPPTELINIWSQKIRKEMRGIDKEIRHVQREQERVTRSIKDAAKKGQKDACVILAKGVIQSKRAIQKLHASKAHMNSVILSMKNQLSVQRIAGAVQQSTEVMEAMQLLVKVPKIQATMRELSKEMMKAGMIEDILQDSFERMEDEEDMEEAADEEVENILFQVTAGALGTAPNKVTDSLPSVEPGGASTALDDETENIEAMHSRLAALRS